MYLTFICELDTFLPEHHQIRFSSGGGHKVSFGQPLFVRLVSWILEELRMLDVEPTPCLTEAERLIGSGAQYEQRVRLQSFRLPLGAFSSHGTAGFVDEYQVGVRPAKTYQMVQVECGYQRKK